MDRRSFLKGLFAAPAIIKTPGLLMPINDFKVGPVLWGQNTLAFDESILRRIIDRNMTRLMAYEVDEHLRINFGIR